jgi:FAD:protein FMN transferase
MGVQIRLALYAPSETAAFAAASAAYARVDELDAVLSDWSITSELTRLCAAQSSGHAPATAVSQDFARVLDHALEIATASAGAFDPTIAPLVALWRESRRSGNLPRAAALAAARQCAGFAAVTLDYGPPPIVRFTKAGMRLDFGGIGKGHALDEAAAVLRSHGVDRFLLSFGGDILAGGPPPGRAGWIVELTGDGELRVPIKDVAISTSGDLEQFVEIDARRYSHVIDPVTGLGCTKLGRATVIGARAATTDALATALCVMSTVEGLALARRFGCEASITRQSRGETESIRSADYPVDPTGR